MSTRLMKERNRVNERMLSNAFHALAFLSGLPSHTERITMTQRISITIVITVRAINYVQLKSIGGLLDHEEGRKGIL